MVVLEVLKDLVDQEVPEGLVALEGQVGSRALVDFWAPNCVVSSRQKLLLLAVLTALLVCKGPWACKVLLAWRELQLSVKSF